MQRRRQTDVIQVERDSGDQWDMRGLDRAARVTRLLRQAGIGFVVEPPELDERLPVVVFEGSRKVYVRRADLESYLAERTFRPGERVREVV